MEVPTILSLIYNIITILYYIITFILFFTISLTILILVIIISGLWVWKQSYRSDKIICDL